MLNKATKEKSSSYVEAINKIIEESDSVVELRPRLKKIWEPSRRSANCSTLISSIPSLQVSVSKPIDVQSIDVSPDVKELYLKRKIGFIGLGMMGQKVVKKLLNVQAIMFLYGIKHQRMSKNLLMQELVISHHLLIFF
ncbi:hypothetical protein TNIN_418071 [Trichonephila inaurata madagascariensis]|uniref:6-phosphogluconate dehydrogenase NADP-binding domain-containing protein n=1 Tax=Trichonephila inaurata madagascariensis TaxID=2747483 RepID=A0A8X6YAT3_9ARAC|nr:hypothetical protein TNIN_418071 [Trichonephila inaurata madagascariensis]